MNETHEERIARLESRVEALEKLLHEASKGKARTSSVLGDCQKAAECPLPSPLNTLAFLPVWQEFCKHRCDLATKGNINRKKFPWTERAAKAVLRKCEAWGAAMAIEALNTSMDKGWADVFEPQNLNGRPAAKVETVWQLKQSLEAVNVELGKLDDKALYDGWSADRKERRAALKERRQELNRKLSGLE